MTTKVSSEKKVDLPPTGERNADPITDAPGSHPIETGIGAALAGAAAGMAAGAVAGPVAAAVGVAAGAVAGGYAGKGIGEMIDPTTDDNWLRDNFTSRPYVEEGDNYEDFRPAYRYGALAEAKFGDAGIDLMDQQLQSDWEASKETNMPWTKAKGAVKDAYERTVQIRRARDVPEVRDDLDVLED
jgi:phage tail tape-measure protein